MHRIVLFSLLIASCSGGVTNVVSTDKDIETKEMVELLEKLDSANKPNEYQNIRLSEFYFNKLKEQKGSFNQRLWYKYCLELVRAGRHEKCIFEIEGEMSRRNSTYTDLAKGDLQQVLELLGLAYLRLGENDNCQKNHNGYSCILPLKSQAFHQNKDGSTKAIEIYSLLAQHSPNAKYKWLLNIAYMTLGKHPGEVPKENLIDYPNWQLERKDFTPFAEISTLVGVGINGLSGGTCVEDFNNDGLLDIFTTSWGAKDQTRLLINMGKGFEEKTDAAGLTGIVGGLNCIHADYNNDGNKDILVLRGAWLERKGAHPNSLLKNNGDGTFSDVTKSAGLLSFYPTQTASWADVNMDGYLDLFIGNESNNGSPNPCELFINQKDGTFKEESKLYGLDSIFAFVKGVTFGDMNNDKWPDLYISVLGGQNLLYKNNKGKFEEVAGIAGVQMPFFSFPCWFWDVNNDGFQDIFVGSYDGSRQTLIAQDFALEVQGKESSSAKPRLFINSGDGKFKEKRDVFGLSKTMYAMGSNFGDLDNDGWLDFYIGTGAPDFTSVVPNRMFRNVEGAKFEEVTSAGQFGHIQKGHAVAFADIDNDGDQDIYAVIGGAFEGDKFPNVLFENPGFTNNWIVLELQGIVSNRDAIGARVKVELEGGRVIYHVISTGGTFGSSSLQAEIGIGKSDQIVSVTVNWPNSEKEVFKDIAINTKYRIVEGESKARKVEYTSLEFNKTKEHEHHHHH